MLEILNRAPNQEIRIITSNLIRVHKIVKMHNKDNDLNNLVNNLSNHPKEDNGTPRNHTETEFLSQDNKEVKVNREVNKDSALNKNRINLRLTLKALTDLNKVNRMSKVLKTGKEDNGMPKNLMEMECLNQDNKEDREASLDKVTNQAREASQGRTDKGLSQDSLDRDLSLDNRDKDLSLVNRDRDLSLVNQDNPDNLLSLVMAKMVINIKIKARIKALNNPRRTIRPRIKETNQDKAINQDRTATKAVNKPKVLKLDKEIKGDREISLAKVLNLDKLRMDKMTMLRRIQDQVRKIIIQITKVTI